MRSITVKSKSSQVLFNGESVKQVVEWLDTLTPEQMGICDCVIILTDDLDVEVEPINRYLYMTKNGKEMEEAAEKAMQAEHEAWAEAESRAMLLGCEGPEDTDYDPGTKVSVPASTADIFEIEPICGCGCTMEFIGLESLEKNEMKVLVRCFSCKSERTITIGYSPF